MGAIQQFFQVFSFWHFPCLLTARHDQVTRIGKKKKKVNGNAVCHICKDASMSQHTILCVPLPLDQGAAAKLPKMQPRSAEIL